MYIVDDIDELLDDCVYALDVIVDGIKQEKYLCYNTNTAMTKLNKIREEYLEIAKALDSGKGCRNASEKILKLDAKTAKAVNKQFLTQSYPHIEAMLLQNKKLRKTLKVMLKTSVPVVVIVSWLERWHELTESIAELRCCSGLYGEFRAELEGCLDSYSASSMNLLRDFNVVLQNYAEGDEIPTCYDVVFQIYEEYDEPLNTLMSQLHEYATNMAELCGIPLKEKM